MSGQLFSLGSPVSSTNKLTSTILQKYNHKPQPLINKCINFSINVTVKRLGGAYGSKISRNFIVSAGCAVAAHLMNRYVENMM